MEKSSLLVLSILFLLALLPVVSAGEYDNFELVANTTSDADGNFSFTDIPNGDYRLASVIYSTAMSGMWLTNVSDFTISDGTPVEISFTMLNNESNDHTAILSYLDRTTISGRTVSKKNAAKVGTDLVLTDQNGEFISNTTSNATGYYCFTDIPNGDYHLASVIYSTAMSGMWLTNVSDFTISDGTPVEIDFTMLNNESNDHTAILSYLDRTTISGRTVSKKNAAKVGTDLVLTDQNGEFISNTTSNATGYYCFTDIPNGDYHLASVIYSTAMSGMWLTNVSDFTISDGTPVEISFTMLNNESNDHSAILSYLDRTTISGRTVSKKNAAKVGTDLILLKKTYVQTGGISHAPHLNISIITGYGSYQAKFDDLLTGINGNSTLNLTISYYLPSTSTEDADFSNTDIIYVNMFTDSAGKLKDAVDAAIANGTVVIGYNTYLNENIPSVPSRFSNEAEFKSYLQDYWIYGATDESNFENLIFYLAQIYGDRDDFTVSSPEGLPSAIYHPDMIEYTCFTNNTSTYFEWYANSSRNVSGHIFDENAPTVGLVFYLSYYPQDMEPIDEIIRELESRGSNVIACYGSSSEYVDQYLNYSASTKVGLILSTTYRSQYFDIENLGVPVINTVQNGYMNLTQWQQVSNPLLNNYMIRLYRPETWGWIDPIMISSLETDPDTGAEVYVSVPEQVDWLVNRSLAQTALSSKNESDKKVVILYYNHGGGKDNIGASYLEVTPSICNLLEGMADEGYDVNESLIPNKTELADLILTQGTNIGTWAPGKLEDLVETGKVELIPEATYKGWFDALPGERRQEVVDMWGEAPGEIMVYEDDSGDRFVVIPKIEISDNVILAPQPTRGWLQDYEALYHDTELPPHHQYIAFYLWLQNEFDADVMVNMGRHGTVEWLPGKEFGLFQDEWPALMAGDIPVVYPYVMDGMGEGMQAKRRGNAVIIDHLIPAVVKSDSYGNYTELSEKINQYNSLTLEPDMKELRFLEIVDMTYELYLDVKVNMALAQNNATKDQFLDELEDTLRELRSASMPYGLHVLGTCPQGEQLSEMVCFMLGNEYTKEVALYNESEDAPYLLLDMVINQGVNVSDAQEQVLGNTTTTISNYLSKGQEYADKLGESENEVQQVLNAMDGKYIESNLGGDPILRPDTLPSGRNFYAFDEQLIPTKQAWDLGRDMANETLAAYIEETGEYPNKIAFVLWAGESTRHEGVMESEILYLLGVRPEWDDDGNEVVDVKLIPASELGRSRIDVMIQISGLYRDTFPHKIELLDKAVYLAYHDPDNKYGKDDERPTPEFISYDPADNTNYVRENTNKLYQSVNETLQNETASMTISLLRIFGPADGCYGTGMANAISATDTWENNTELAELYLDRMSHAYGQYVWGESMADIVSQWDVANDSINNTDIFAGNLKDVDATVHSRSSNTYGAMDTDDFYQYLGGLNMVVEYLSGNAPESYVLNLQNPREEQIETLKSYLTKEIITRYLNPKWTAGMQENGAEGAAQIADIIGNMVGWKITCPDLIDDSILESMYETYLGDSEYSEWFKETNPYSYQSANADMVSLMANGDWDPSDEIKQQIVQNLVESVVAENSPCCCILCCGSTKIQDYVEGVVNTMVTEGSIDQDTALSYQKIMQDATQPEDEDEPEKTANNHPLESVKVVNSSQISGSDSNQTTTSSEGGYGESANPPEPDVVEGYEMTPESQQPEDSGGMSFSGADIIGTVLVLLAVGVMYAGYRRRGR
jgi:cobaltochelatase CobN